MQNQQPSFINLNELFQNLLISARRTNVYDPIQLFKGIQRSNMLFRGNQQQDASELLRYLLDGLSQGEETLNKKPQIKGSKTNCEIKDLFGMYLCNRVQCKQCQEESWTFDYCQDLQVQILAQSKELLQMKQQQKIQQAKKINIIDDYEGEEIKKQGNQQEEDNLKQEQQEQEKKKQNEKELEVQLKQNQQQQQKQEQQQQQQTVQQEQNQQQTVKQEQNQQQQEEEEKKQNKINETLPYIEIKSAPLFSKDTKIPNFDKSSETLLQPNANILKGKQKITNCITLEDCLKDFFKLEPINFKRNSFQCQKCKKEGVKGELSQARRKFYLYETPKVLTIILKRFQQKSMKVFEKLNNFIEIPEILDLQQFTLIKMKQKNTVQQFLESSQNKLKFQYELYAMVVHSGQINGGHYVSYVKHRINGEDKWFHYSDTHFKEVSVKAVLQAQGYIVFYRRI